MLINVILGIDCEIYLVIVLQARWANCSEPSINGFGKREKTFKFTVTHSTFNVTRVSTIREKNNQCSRI